MTKRFVFFILLMGHPFFLGASNFDQAVPEGWSWYLEAHDLEPSLVPLAPTSFEQAEKVPDDPLTVMQHVRQSMERELSRALLEPTPDNILHYIRLQNAWASRASQFSDQWQRVLLTYPGLNYSLKVPTNGLALQTKQLKEQRDERRVFDALRESTGLFFFFRSHCPHCHTFAPILKQFSKREGIAVLPISLDGEGLPDYPDFVVDRGQAEKLNVAVVPAVFAASPQTQAIVPIVFGAVTEDILTANLIRQLSRESDV